MATYELKDKDFDNIEAWVTLPSSFFGNGLNQENDNRPRSDRYFIMNADGDGMVNAGIHNEDVIIFYRTKEAPSGSICAVRLNDGQTMCRRYLREGKRIRLRRENGITPDLLVDDCEVLGVMVTLVRKFNHAVSEG